MQTYIYKKHTLKRTHTDRKIDKLENHMRANTNTQSQALAYTHAPTHPSTHKHKHKHTHAHTHTPTNTQTHTRSHKDTHKHKLRNDLFLSFVHFH